MENIRKPAVAGGFYPGDKRTLTKMIEESLDNAVDFSPKGKVKAVVVPHAGYIYSGVVAAAGFKILGKLNKTKNWKILLIGPSHFEWLQGGAAPEVEGWETPLGVIPVNNILNEIGGSNIITPAEEIFTQEHSLEVEVPFLQTVMKKWTLYPLCLGDIDPSALAQELKNFASQDNVILVISSDLSHYYSYEDAKALDDNANKFIPMNSIKEVEDRVEACGIKGILTLMHLAELLNWKGHFVDYKNSGDTAGDKSQVVGYGCYLFTE